MNINYNALPVKSFTSGFYIRVFYIRAARSKRGLNTDAVKERQAIKKRFRLTGTASMPVMARPYFCPCCSAIWILIMALIRSMRAFS